MSAYDQTKGELCEKCGWAMKFPGAPCRCDLERENATLRDIASAAKDLIDYERAGYPGWPDWDYKFDALRAALEKGAKLP